MPPSVSDLAADLVAVPTVSPVTDPEPFHLVADLLAAHGVEAEVAAIDGVYHLTAETGTGPPTVCFNGHVDVVEPGAREEWTVTDPFEPTVVDGDLYGRGAADMKGALAAEILAFLDLHRDGDFDGRAVLMVVGDEEVGGHRGTAVLVDDYPDVDYVVVGEATDLDVQVGTRGTAWYDAVLRGEGIHVTRTADAAANVVAALPEAIERLAAVELAHEPHPELPDPNVEVSFVRTDNTYAAGAGGDGDGVELTYNSLPGRAHLGLDVRYLPDQDVDAIRRALAGALDGLDVEATVELETDHGGAYVLEDESFGSVVTEVLAEVRDVPVESVRKITEGGASDGRFFGERGVPFVEIGVEQEPVHQADEHCSVEDLKMLREAYAEIARRLAATFDGE